MAHAPDGEEILTRLATEHEETILPKHFADQVDYETTTTRVEVDVEERLREEQQTVSNEVPVGDFDPHAFDASEDLPPQRMRDTTIEVLDTHYRHDCSNCDGGGSVTCSTCHGDGTQTCPKCTGDGVISASDRCANCDGSGSISGTETCSQCQGRGRITVDGEDERCPNCRGGTVEVENVCPECNGKGSFDRQQTCPDCGGDVRVTCRSCSGSGKRRCQTCAGTGESVVYTADRHDFHVDRSYRGVTAPDVLADHVSPDPDSDAWSKDDIRGLDDPDATLAREVTYVGAIPTVEYEYDGEEHEAYAAGGEIVAEDPPSYSFSRGQQLLGVGVIGAVPTYFLTDIGLLPLLGALVGLWLVLKILGKVRGAVA